MRRALRATPLKFLVWFCIGLAIALTDQGSHAATSEWWDSAYGYRQNVIIATGAVTPDKGYAGYTMRASALDTQSLIAQGKLAADCRDLRVLYFSGTGWVEVPRDLRGCNTTDTDVRFMAQGQIPASTSDDNYYFYYGNSAAGPAQPVTPTNVYLWYDDALTDRSGSYLRGRIDAWHGTGWDNSLAWNAGGFYTYDNGDNFTSGYRRAVDERDVLIEAAFFHTDCYPINMTTGLVVRGIIQSGSGGSETASHYYASNRGEFPQSGCGNPSGYAHDGDIIKGARTTTVVDGANPGDVAANQWRRQALAAFSVNPTQLRFWDEDSVSLWNADGFPGNSNLHVAGSDSSDLESRGFAGVMTAQDRSRLRNVVIRRYVEPEPALTTLAEEVRRPGIAMDKSSRVVSDPVNLTLNPKRIPGAVVEYRLVVRNAGTGSPDSDTLVIDDPIPSNIALCVSAACMGGATPVQFVDGAEPSGLNFLYLRDVSFSGNNGADGYGYAPVPDSGGFDAGVTDVRISPRGTFRAQQAGAAPSFELVLRARVAN